MDITVPTEGVLNTTTEANTYKVMPEGKRVATTLLIGVLAIAVFAVWTIVSMSGDGLSGAEWVTALLMLALVVLAPFVSWNLLEERAAVITTDNSGLTFRSLGGVELVYPWSQVRGLRSAAERKNRLVSFLFDEQEKDLALEKAPASGINEASDAVSASEAVSNNSVLPANSENEETVVKPTAGKGSNASKGTADDDEDEPAIEDRETLEIVVADPKLERITNPLSRALHKQAHGRFVPIYPSVENRARLIQEIARRATSQS